MGRRPFVSVIIPAYNYGRYLESCLTSVLSQPGVDLEVLVIDDASTDETRHVAMGMAATDPRVEVRSHVRNLGHIATYNEGLAWASGDYIALLSADDLLTPGALARAAQLLDAHPEVGLVYGGAVLFQDGTELPDARTPERPKWEIRPGRDWIRARCRAAESAIVSPEVVVRASLQRAVGGYRAELPHTGDLEMWLRFACRSDVGRLPDADQAYHRRHEQSMQRRDFASFVHQTLQRKAAFDLFFAGHGRTIQRARPLHLMAHRTLAYTAMVRAAKAALPGAPAPRRENAGALWRLAARCLDDVDNDRVHSVVLPARVRMSLRRAVAVVVTAPRAAAISVLAGRDFASIPGGAALRRLGVAPRWRSADSPGMTLPAEQIALGSPASSEAAP
jgi:glycosyltransferase involved in cell wall biosynthesis